MYDYLIEVKDFVFRIIIFYLMINQYIYLLYSNFVTNYSLINIYNDNLIFFRPYEKCLYLKYT
jgi:hypothetical protein